MATRDLSWPDPLPERIVVIGSPGSGKSRLSKLLAARLELPLTHLDRLFWEPGWVSVGHEEFARRQEDILAGDRWIVDGNYGSTMAMRLARAELVVWLDPPTWQSMRGVMRRWWTDEVRTDTPDGCPDRPDWEFFHYVLTFRLVRRPVNLSRLKDYRGHVRILRSRKDVARFVENLPGPA